LDVNRSNCSGWTPLLIAAFRGNEEIVAAILGHPKVDVNKGNKGGDDIIQF
jgi:ankyrin repeat protein